MQVQLVQSNSGMESQVCLIPSLIIEQLSVKKGARYEIQVGQRKINVVVDSHDHNHDQMYLPDNVFNHLLLIDKMFVNVWIRNGIIHLGPVIGIFVNPRFIQRIEEGCVPVSATEHVKANTETHAFLYYFSLDNIYWFKEQITGYVYNELTQSWEQRNLPMPNVIYDRAVKFDTSLKPLVKHIRNQFHEHDNIHYINQVDYFGKWDVYKALSKYKDIKSYLPETEVYERFEQVKEMLDNYHLLFLKSFYGSLGKEVMAITKVAEGYDLSYYEKGLKTIQLSSLSDVKEYVNQFLKNKKYIIQQGIHVKRYGGKQTDVRVLVQKDASGKWIAAPIQTRVSKRDSAITNESLGGEVAHYDALFKHDSNMPTDHEVKEFAIHVTSYLEKEYGSLGEVGIDLAIDQRGEIWFIEANAKPDKNPVKGFDDTEEILPQFLSVLEYGTYLADGHLISPHKSWTLTIKECEGSHNVITVPTFIFERLSNNEISLKVGLNEREVNVRKHDLQESIIIPSSILEKLHIQEDWKVNVKVEDGHSLRIGPVIAVFSSNGNVKKLLNQQYRFRSEELALANNDANTILYLFTVKDVNFLDRTINGTFYNEMKKKWEKKVMPFPDILYDRGGGVLKHQKHIGRFIREQFKQHSHIQTVNAQHYFDKWKLHEQLYKQQEVRQFMPVTLQYEKREDIDQMLSKYHTIYVKDRQGSNGKGIMRIKRVKDRYHYSYVADDLFEEYCDDLAELIKGMDQFFDQKKLIIQQGIDVLQVGEQPIDMRATVQRNHLGQLEIVAYPVRIGKERAPITSTRTGSDVYQFDYFFTKILSYKKNELIHLNRRIETFIFKVYEAVEKEFGTFGELGIDFALDQGHNIWFIECNAKPGQDSLFISYDRNTIKRAFLNPLQYAKYLTGFS
ncbi:YheC/YheD family endospore coat-associated protein [Salirhabdus salicampi]|uniref:YheC/YheD family endospore coat-associated protein n=1 Tax=Salirhabdus salicampi TaxID=476102 RepID=UPI0020C41B73|nr:YheC/YheD family protein [Salirhabdus salicampi]MCP8617182.1 YheC/YheD family protein [Salirhabdus salicampi]